MGGPLATNLLLCDCCTHVPSNWRTPQNMSQRVIRGKALLLSTATQYRAHIHIHTVRVRGCQTCSTQ
eukprot:10599305-Prorocentrum_lima.AAC.1